MAALAYLLLPVSGAFAFFLARSRRVRFHGLQAIVYGVAWPALLYAASLISSGAAVVVAGLGAIGWAGLIVLTAFGADPRIPGAKRLFALSDAES